MFDGVDGEGGHVGVCCYPPVEVIAVDDVVVFVECFGVHVRVQNEEPFLSDDDFFFNVKFRYPCDGFDCGTWVTPLDPVTTSRPLDCSSRSVSMTLSSFQIGPSCDGDAEPSFSAQSRSEMRATDARYDARIV